MTWLQTEFLLKGVYLGLLLMVAWLIPTWDELALIALFTVGGLVLFLGWAAVQKIREGYHVKGRWLGFLIFLVLENPGMVYAGLLLGLSCGAGWTFNWWRRNPEQPDIHPNIPIEALWPVLGGAVLGGIFYGLRHVRQRLYRFWIGIALVAVLVGGAAAFWYFKYDVLKDRLHMIGTLLLLGIPGFYLLTFSGMVEESEIEIAAMCAALGIGAAALLPTLTPAAGGAAVLLPIGLFFVYTTRVMPGLRVFKHALRGMSYRQMGQTKLALISLSRALQFDPKNALARQQLWDLHRELNVAELKQHPELIPLLNFNFCLERISQTLASKPSPAALRDTYHMLDLIDREQPELQPVTAYWWAVAYLHEHRHGDAAEWLISILKLPQTDTPQRQAVHYSAWLLAMYGHPEMTKQVAEVLLPQPGERMDAIAAVERQLALTPEDPAAWDMKRQLYSELTEAEYWTAIQPLAPSGERGRGEGPPPILFSHEYTQQLGLALLDNAEQWPRGCAYLRIAANGMSLQAAGIYIQIAQTHEKHGDKEGMWANYQKAMQLGRAIGVEQLPAADKEALFATVKKIGETALAQNEIDTALAAFKFFAEHGNPGIETYRVLAELFERKKDAWMALYSTEFGLTYNSADKDLIARKDRYYYSITPAELKERLESVRKWFDPQYCRDKARWILENWGNDFDNLDWATHLLELANVAQPGSHANRFLKARIHRLRGEIPEAIAVLEEVRQHRPEKFVNEDEEKAWYFAHRMLGDLYLEEKPAEAEACYLEFRQSDESGADTTYKLGRAFEAQGKLREAIRCYEEVTAYERHPLYYEARDALDRVKGGAAPSRPA